LRDIKFIFAFHSTTRWESFVREVEVVEGRERGGEVNDIGEGGEGVDNDDTLY